MSDQKPVESPSLVSSRGAESELPLQPRRFRRRRKHWLRGQNGLILGLTGGSGAIVLAVLLWQRWPAKPTDIPPVQATRGEQRATELSTTVPATTTGTTFAEKRSIATSQADPAQVRAARELGGRTGLFDKKTGRLTGLLFDNKTQVTDARLVHLKVLTDLQSLDLRGAQVTDAGLAHLEGLAKLRELDLKGIPVTDAGLVHLRGLLNLQMLNLSGTQVTDTGLVHLQGLSNLQILDFSGTQVTEAGRKELQVALPKCDIN